MWGTWGSGVSVIAELKRRNVVRVAVLYGLAAWLILQVADVLVPALGLPGWVMRFVALLLILGFPLVLIFSWVYELTPEGLKKQQEVDLNQSITHETGRKINYLIGALAVLAIVVVAVERFIPRTAPIPAATEAAPGAPPAEAPVQAAAKSIAVLPFADMSAGKDQEYFADGLSEELLNLLAKLPELRVIGRTSSFQFKGRNEDLRVIGEKLNVAHILEGSVRKSGEKVRITAQLIRAADGSHLWSETYDRTLDDIFVVQDDIAGEVVKALKLTLLGTTSMTRSRPVDSEAYNLALQGRFFLERRGQEDLERAVDYFRRSRERDPDYAPAWAGLSRAYARQADNGFVPAADGYRRAREAAEKALALDPQLADAHLAMGWIQHSLRLGLGGRGRQLSQSTGPGARQRPGPQARRQPGADPRTLERSDRPGEQGHRARSAAAELLQQPRPRVAGSQPRHGGRGRVSQGPRTRSRRSLFGIMALGLALLLQGKTDAALREMQQETEEVWRLSGLPLAFHALGRRSESDAALAALKEQVRRGNGLSDRRSACLPRRGRSGVRVARARL